jgi:hypothetical protein
VSKNLGQVGDETGAVVSLLQGHQWGGRFDAMVEVQLEQRNKKSR